MELRFDRPSKHQDIARQVITTVRKYFRLVGYQNWEVEISWNQVDGKYGAECTAKPEYYKAELNFDLETLSGLPDQIDAYVRHEVLHCLAWALSEAGQLLCGEDDGAKELIQKLEERLVTDLERMPVWDSVSE